MAESNDELRNKIIAASATSFHAQRNWDRSQTVPQQDIDTLIQAITTSPTKQAETHYRVYWSKDPELIYNVYSRTKHFSVTPQGTVDYTDADGVTLDEYNVTNSQTYSNLLFAFAFDWDQTQAGAKQHAIVDMGKASDISIQYRDKHRCFSIGVAIGELILTANLLGYRTGLCSAYMQNEIAPYFDGATIEVLVGVGYPSDRPRTEHEEVYNRDIAAVDRRTGELDEKWLFPALEKKMLIQQVGN
jgi:nitroreductase